MPINSKYQIYFEKSAKFYMRFLAVANTKINLAEEIGYFNASSIKPPISRYIATKLQIEFILLLKMPFLNQL